MPRIIVAGASEASRAQLTRLLAASGLGIFRQCASGGELRRTLNECEDGIAILAGTLPGAPADELAADFGDAFQLLMISRPEALEACESPRVFKLAFPCPGSRVVGAVEMLCQLHAMRMPRRSDGDRALVEEAKRLIMRREGIDEPAAHRHIQQYAMRHNMKMTDYAAQLLQGGSNDV
ncbi:MAG: ANTAR domain-containing protein [Clostridia bacterium]|nr:ANTAR domain-containing protein [Clostridia bacterium]